MVSFSGAPLVSGFRLPLELDHAEAAAAGNEGEPPARRGASIPAQNDASMVLCGRSPGYRASCGHTRAYGSLMRPVLENEPPV